MWDQQTVPLNTKDAEQIHQAEVTTRSEDLVRFSATWDHLTDGDITHRNPTALGQFRHQPPFILGSESSHGKSSKAICHHRSPVKMAIESMLDMPEPWEELSCGWLNS